ncbi:hypothetical protein [Sagittula sp. S175]|uniref:hypothetical protein n=1 Tax=Sagittula sp. S175 TaxID=3415129 RepID=UPI003C7CF9C6
MRLLLVPGVVALFWPDLIVEGVGFGLVVVLLGMNWVQARRANTLTGGPSGAPGAAGG